VERRDWGGMKSKNERRSGRRRVGKVRREREHSKELLGRFGVASKAL